MIDKKIRKLSKPDFQPMILLPQWSSDRTKHANLIVVRNGETKSLMISKKVAEELIAAGFSYGN